MAIIIRPTSSTHVIALCPILLTSLIKYIPSSFYSLMLHGLKGFTNLALLHGSISCANQCISLCTFNINKDYPAVWVHSPRTAEITAAWMLYFREEPQTCRSLPGWRQCLAQPCRGESGQFLHAPDDWRTVKMQQLRTFNND